MEFSLRMLKKYFVAILYVLVMPFTETWEEISSDVTGFYLFIVVVSVILVWEYRRYKNEKR